MVNVVIKCVLLYFVTLCYKGVKCDGRRQGSPYLIGNFDLAAQKWDSAVFKDDNTVRDDTESGFDLTDEEIKKLKLWPRGNIPYYIDVQSFSDKVLRDRIRWFLNVVNSATNLNFIELFSPPKDKLTRWVIFINRRSMLGCADHSIKNFTNEGVQRVVLGYDCMSTGGELAEAVLAIAGVPAQHNAPNRDEYIKVVEENIISEKKYLFEKLKDDEWLFYDIKYDFSSAGHYHYHKYSVNGKATIETQNEYFGTSLGETKGLSLSDIRKLRMLYNFISKNKVDKLSGCNKLFVRGAQFDSYQPNNKKIKPRRKPNKYLGLAEDENNYTEIENSKNITEIEKLDLKNPESSSENNYTQIDNGKTLSKADSKPIENEEDGKNVPQADSKAIDDEEDGENLPKADSKAIDNEEDSKKLPQALAIEGFESVFESSKDNEEENTGTLKKHSYDPLSYLFDYNTGDDNNEKKPEKTKTGIEYMKFGKLTG